MSIEDKIARNGYIDAFGVHSDFSSWYEEQLEEDFVLRPRSDTRRVRVSKFGNNLSTPQRRGTMLKRRGSLVRKVIWTTGRGEEIDITDMSDSHILNTMAYLQSKKERLNRTEYECNAVDEEVKRIDEYIEAFVDELNERDRTGKHIERGYYE